MRIIAVQKMNQQKKLFVLETIHIPLWLFKDLCWLMTWRTFGIVMAVPTIIVAFALVWLTRKDTTRFLPNVSIAFWITANANWMVDEFYDLNTRYYSIIPFVLGIITFVIYVIQEARNKA